MKESVFKISSFIIVCGVLLSLLAISTFAEPALSADKSEYASGEAIYVTATGEGSDWVGIYLESDTVGNEPAILWYYIAKDSNTSGTAKNIFTAENHASDRDELLTIPAGNYKICLCTNDSYDVAASVSITVTASTVQPVADKSVECDKTEYTEGEPIMITAAGDGDDWVGIYKKGETPDDAYSIRWYYIAKEGNTSGAAKNIFEAEHTERPDDADLPAGEYTVVLFENGGYDVIDSVEITVTAAAQTEESATNAPTGDALTVIVCALALISAAGFTLLIAKRSRVCE